MKLETMVLFLKVFEVAQEAGLKVIFTENGAGAAIFSGSAVTLDTKAIYNHKTTRVAWYICRAAGMKAGKTGDQSEEEFDAILIAAREIHAKAVSGGSVA